MQNKKLTIEGGVRLPLMQGGLKMYGRHGTLRREVKREGRRMGESKKE